MSCIVLMSLGLFRSSLLKFCLDLILLLNTCQDNERFNISNLMTMYFQTKKAQTRYLWNVY